MAGYWPSSLFEVEGSARLFPFKQVFFNTCKLYIRLFNIVSLPHHIMMAEDYFRKFLLLEIVCLDRFESTLTESGICTQMMGIGRPFNQEGIIAIVFKGYWSGGVGIFLSLHQEISVFH